MPSDLQLLVDRLAARVGAPTLLEDRDQRMVAYSSQAGPIDAARRDSILHRHTAPEVVSWFRAFGICSTRRPLRTPADPEAGILARLCAPAWYRDELCGFLWLIDVDEALTGEALEEVAKAAEHAALMLYEERLAQRLVDQALAYLLSPSEELREAAAHQLVDQSLWRKGEPTAVVVVQALSDADTASALDGALADVGWEAPAGALLRLSCADHGVLLVRLGAADDDRVATEIAASAGAQLARRLSDSSTPPRVVAAVGDPQDDLGRVVSSYRQARLAVRVASCVPALGDVVRWCDLGVFRALAQLADQDAVDAALDPRVVTLLGAGDHDLVETLETYLDLAGDAKATAEALHLHRGTLYYRLDKAERIAGIDVHNGNDRLAVHLGLKLARLYGIAEADRRRSPRPGRRGKVVPLVKTTAPERPRQRHKVG